MGAPLTVSTVWVPPKSDYIGFLSNHKSLPQTAVDYLISIYETHSALPKISIGGADCTGATDLNSCDIIDFSKTGKFYWKRPWI